MKNNLTRCGLFALALTVGLSAAPASAQEFSSLYVTPKVLYSRQSGDMSKANWTQNGWSRGVLEGKEKDDSFGFGLALGNDFSYSSAYPFRLEAEYVYHGEGKFGKGPSIVNSLDNAGNYIASQKFNIKAHSLMVNGFYDVNMDSAFTPYIGGGIGMAYLKSSYTSDLRVNGNEGHRVSTSSNDWRLAWNIGGGVSYALDNQISLDFGYRYYDLGTAEPGSVNYSSPPTGYRGSPEVDLTAHEFSVGLRFSGF